MSTTIEKMVEYTSRVREGVEDVKPGTPVAFTTASTPNDCIWQGDLGLVISDKSPPKDYVRSFKPNLVPGNTIGSRHCLESMDGVELYVPAENWTEDSMNAPFLVCHNETKVVHPIHGDVTIPAGYSIECVYQREWDREQAAERRAKD